MLDAVPRTAPPIRRRHGVTLLESLIAVGLLVVVVTAVLGAMNAGRRMSDEGRRLTMAALASEVLLARVCDVDADAHEHADGWYRQFTNAPDNGGWNGHTEGHGAIRADRDPSADLLPEDYQDFALSVHTSRTAHRIEPPLSVQIEGVHVQVRADDEQGRSLSVLERFVPLPQHLAEAME